MKHRLFSLTALVFILSLWSSGSAQAAKNNVQFTSNPVGVTVTVEKLSSKSRKVLGSCQTPCALALKPNKMGKITFSHPDYLAKTLAPSEYRGSLDNNSEIVVDMGPSLVALQNLAGRQFMEDNAERLQERLTGPDQLPTEVARVPPFFPPAADRSGWCKVKFDVNTVGRVENFEIVICSEEVFSRPTRSSTLQWQYAPGVLNGKFTARRGMESFVDYTLVDDDGNPIPPLIPKPITE